MEEVVWEEGQGSLRGVGAEGGDDVEVVHREGLREDGRKCAGAWTRGLSAGQRLKGRIRSSSQRVKQPKADPQRLVSRLPTACLAMRLHVLACVALAAVLDRVMWSTVIVRPFGLFLERYCVMKSTSHGGRSIRGSVWTTTSIARR